MRKRGNYNLIDNYLNKRIIEKNTLEVCSGSGNIVNIYFEKNCGQDIYSFKYIDKCAKG